MKLPDEARQLKRAWDHLQAPPVHLVYQGTHCGNDTVARLFKDIVVDELHKATNCDACTVSRVAPPSSSSEMVVLLTLLRHQSHELAEIRREGELRELATIRREGELRQELAVVKEMTEDIQGKVTTMHQQLVDIATQQNGILGDVKATMDLLRVQANQLAQISYATNATLDALTTLVQGDKDVPRLVLVKLATGGPTWKGSWHNYVGDNVLARFKTFSGCTETYQLRFLCEKTLKPVDGEKGYELTLHSHKFKKFVHNAGAALSMTCAVLKLVVAVARPVAMIAGVELPTLDLLDLSAVRSIKVGATDLGHVFEGTEIGGALDQMDGTDRPKSIGYIGTDWQRGSL